MTQTMKPDLLQVAKLPPFVLDPLRPDFEIHDYANCADRELLLGQVANRVRGILASGMAGPDAALINRLPQLEIISSFSVGYDSTDISAAKARNVIVTNTPDVLTDDVADLAMSFILALPRRVPEAERYLRAGNWLKAPMALGSKVTGKRLGIVGLGRIGSAIAKRAQGFDMTIHYNDIAEREGSPYRFFPDLLELARNSDTLVAATIGGPTTQGLINAAVLDALGPKGFFVNICRGSVVDEPALIAALQERKIAGAALDVFTDEPNVPQELMIMDNVILTPHIASGTTDTRLAMAQLVIDNLRNHFAGRPVLTPV
jgi:lactate dehydrogenase-like 2-hydroxyacid dehydrogenase